MLRWGVEEQGRDGLPQGLDIVAGGVDRSCASVPKVRESYQGWEQEFSRSGDGLNVSWKRIRK